MVGLLTAEDYAGYAAEGKRLAVDLPEVTAMDAAKFIAEATPIIGDAMAAKEVWDEATSENPNWALVGALGGATLLGLIPGVGDAAAKAVKAGARGLLDTAKRVEVDPNAMGSLLGNVRLKPKGDEPPKIRAYQGTPHTFSAERLVRMPDGSTQYIVGSPDVLPDIPAGAEVLEDLPLGRMRMDKIGTGEGAQAYGYGMYAAEAEDVAKVYRDQLSNSDTAAAQRVLDRFDGDVNKAILDTHGKFDRLIERFKTGAFEGAEKRYYDQRQIQYNKIMQLEQLAETGQFPTGSMYEININANPDDFLDYDAPLSNQTGRAAEYISNYEMLTGQPILPLPTSQKTNTGKDLMLKIGGEKLRAGAENPSAEISDYLRTEGIPGIKYLDAGSRGTADATRNFVVFDEKLINIVKRYGVAGAAAMLGVAAMDVEQAMAQGMQQPSGLLTPDMINSQQANQRPYNAGLLQ